MNADVSRVDAAALSPSGPHQDAYLIEKLAHLARTLADRSDLVVVHDGHDLQVEPRTAGSGFPITVRAYKAGCRVDLGGCDLEFDDIDQACDWVLRAVSSDYRLRIDLRGSVPYCWSIERQSGSAAEVVLSYGHARLPTWLWPFNSEPQVIHRAYAPLV